MAASRSATALTIHPSELSTYHRNPRRGDVSVIAASLQAHGQYKPVVVNRGTYTGRANEVLAGNHTLLAVRDLAEKHPDDARWQQVLVHWVDVDDDRAARIVLVDNRASEVGGFDTSELAALLNDVKDDLTGIGYSALDVADLNALLEENQVDLSDLGGDPFAGVGRGSTPPRPEGEGLLTGAKDMEEQADSYAEAATRMVILHLPIPQFIWAQEHLEKLRADMNVRSNSEVVMELIHRATNSPVPEA